MERGKTAGLGIKFTPRRKKKMTAYWKRKAVDIAAKRFFVKLAGEKVELSEKSILKMPELRQELSNMIRLIISENEDIVREVFDKAEGGDEIGVLSNADIAVMLPKVIPILLGDGLDFLCETLFLYEPELRKYEPETPSDIGPGKASDEEIVDAALEVLSVVFPLVRSLVKSSMSMIVQKEKKGKKKKASKTRKK